MHSYNCSIIMFMSVINDKFRTEKNIFMTDENNKFVFTIKSNK